MEERTKRSIADNMRVRSYDVLRRAIEEGVEYGWRRAHKHTETPDEVIIKDHVITGILNEICEYFDFDEERQP